MANVKLKEFNTIPKFTNKLKKFETTCPICGKKMVVKAQSVRSTKMYICEAAGPMRYENETYMVCFGCSRWIHSEEEFKGTMEGLKVQAVFLGEENAHVFG